MIYVLTFLIFSCTGSLTQNGSQQPFSAKELEIYDNIVNAMSEATTINDLTEDIDFNPFVVKENMTLLDRGFNIFFGNLTNITLEQKLRIINELVGALEMAIDTENTNVKTKLLAFNINRIFTDLLNEINTSSEIKDDLITFTEGLAGYSFLKEGIDYNDESFMDKVITEYQNHNIPLLLIAIIQKAIKKESIELLTKISTESPRKVNVGILLIEEITVGNKNKEIILQLIEITPRESLFENYNNTTILDLVTENISEENGRQEIIDKINSLV